MSETHAPQAQTQAEAALRELAEAVEDIKHKLFYIAWSRIPDPEDFEEIEIDDDVTIKLIDDADEDLEWLAIHYEDAEVEDMDMWGVHNMLSDVVFLATKYPRRYKEFRLESLVDEVYTAVVEFKSKVNSIEPAVDLVVEARNLAGRFIKSLEKAKEALDEAKKYLGDDSKWWEYGEACKPIIHAVKDVSFHLAELEDKLEQTLGKNKERDEDEDDP